MSLSISQVKSIGRLTFDKPYTYQQLANLIHASKREVYDYFRTKKAEGLFNIIKHPWTEILEEADPKLAKGKRTHYKKWVQDPAVYVRLSAQGYQNFFGALRGSTKQPLGLTYCDAKLKPEFCGAGAGPTRQRERLKDRQLQKEVFRKLNYSQQVLELLQVGALTPRDLPRSGFPGSNKYLALYPEKSGSFSEFESIQEASISLPEASISLPEASIALPEAYNAYQEAYNAQCNSLGELPEGWARFDQSFQEKTDSTQAFGSCGLPYGEELLELPYSWDLAFSNFDKDMWKKFNHIKWGKCGEERREAISLILKNQVKNFGFTIDKLDKFGNRIFIPQNEEIKDQIEMLFYDYKQRTTNECLVMLPKKDYFGLPLLLKNANRFNDEQKKIVLRLRYENLFRDASSRYKSAVMVTLTTDQKLHANMFEANKTHQDNWNRLIIRIRKEAKDERIRDLIRKNPEFLKVKVPKHIFEIPSGSELAAYEFSSDVLTPHPQKSLQAFLEASNSFQCRTRARRIHEGLQGDDESDSQYFKRIQKQERLHNVSAAELRAAAEEYIKSDNSLKFPYICVREYQKNGNVHFHIIIFGIRWLMPAKKLSQLWEEYGQGSQVNLNAIRLDEERGYVWESGEAPEDSQGRQPMEYLKKYLLKGQYFDDASTQYWLNSSRFFTYSQSLLSDENRTQPIVSKGYYEFAGVCCLGLWVQNGDDFVCLQPVEAAA